MYHVIVNDNSFLFQGLAPGSYVRGQWFFKGLVQQVFAQGLVFMHLFRGTVLLFILNLFDALLTIVWVRSGVATEGNHLMAAFLEIGDLTFLTAKIAIGTIAAIVLLKWGYLRLAKYGLSVALAVYISLMGIHLFTGLTAFGYVSNQTILDATEWSSVLFAFFF